MRRIRTAVIGVGRQGRRHGEKLAGLSEARLVAAPDADRGRAGAVAAELGVDAAGDLADLAGGTDAAVVATPTPTHFEIAAALLERGIHVLLEKPLAQTLEQAAALVELAEARGLVLQVGHLERFNPAVIALAARIGNPRFIEAHRIAPFREQGLDVSVVLDLMIHDIDLIHAFAGAPVTHAEASGGRVFSDQVERVRFTNGCVAKLSDAKFDVCGVMRGAMPGAGRLSAALGETTGMVHPLGHRALIGALPAYLTLLLDVFHYQRHLQAYPRLGTPGRSTGDTAGRVRGCRPGAGLSQTSQLPSSLPQEGRRRAELDRRQSNRCG